VIKVPLVRCKTHEKILIGLIVFWICIFLIECAYLIYRDALGWLVPLTICCAIFCLITLLQLYNARKRRINSEVVIKQWNDALTANFGTDS
jgi:hypothetical protein